MSDNEDLLGDDLGDHSLADYNLGNDEEDQLLADDYDSGPSQNVPSSIASAYREPVNVVPVEYPGPAIEYNQPAPYIPAETECVVPNITVEVPNTAPVESSTYAPYSEQEHGVVPPAIPAAPIESPQIVPSEMTIVANVEEERTTERVARAPLPRNVPDSLDKVFVPRNPFNSRGRNSWRNPQYRQNHPYRRNNTFRGNFNQRPSFPPPNIRPQAPPQMHPEMPPQMRPEMPPQIRPDMPPEIRELPPRMGPEISPERPMLPQELPIPPPLENRNFNPNFQRFPFRPNMEERPNFGPNIGPNPNFERPMFYQRPYNPRQFGPPMREIAPNNNHLPQVTIRQPMVANQKREPEVRMLPVQLPPNLPPGGLAGKKVLINPHFKGNFQPPVEGPIKDIDDAAERFIAEQRNALAKAANRKIRRSPQRYIENTTIEIENDLVRRGAEDDLLRRQEEFINANRAGLRRRMRSPSPVRRSPSPRRSPERRPRPPPDEESEYRRRLREQESLRERVLRAKEVRRRKNAVALQKNLQEREREKEQEKEKAINNEPPTPTKDEPKPQIKEKPTETVEQDKPDTTRKTPERERDRVIEKEKEKDRGRERSPVKVESAEANSTCENLTPPRPAMPARPSPERALTPPLPEAKGGRVESDDDLDLILDDIDDILSDDDSGRFKEKTKPMEAPKPKPPVDLRSKLPPKASEPKKPRQKIVYNEQTEEKRKKEKSPPIRRTILSGSNKNANSQKVETKPEKVKPKIEISTSTMKSRQKIIFENKESVKDDNIKDTKEDETKPKFSNRRVILQRKPNADKTVFNRADNKDATGPNPGIFSRAVRTAIGTDKNRFTITRSEPKPKPEPEIEYESGSDLDEDKLLSDDVGNMAIVGNLPHGMTDTRLKTLAGNDVQSLSLDKEDRSAKITFKTTIGAENFKKKFNNKMVAASRLTVTLR